MIRTEMLQNNLFVLLEPVSATVGTTDIEVPRGYVTDFASIPSTLHWWLRPTDHRAARAAIVHDWLYHTHLYPRCVADAFFLVVLRQDGMPRRKAKLLTWAVRQFGKLPYMRGPAELLSRAPNMEKHINPTPSIE